MRLKCRRRPSITQLKTGCSLSRAPPVGYVREIRYIGARRRLVTTELAMERANLNLVDKKGLRVVVHGMLAMCGVILLGTGLAMLSGVADIDGTDDATSLLMVRPVPDSTPRAGSSAAASPPAVYEPAPPPVPPHIAEPPRREGRPGQWHTGQGMLAIVIDDIGHDLQTTRGFLALNAPLTFSVLPGVRLTRESAQLIARAGREFIIHLPMEPLAYPAKDPGPRPLLLSLDGDETARRVREYLERLPGASGASNHMGSAYTYNAEKMRVVQSILDQRDLYFLNSKTSGTDVPGRIARRWGYRYLERDVFLDHDPSERAIERYFHLAVHRARGRGRAVAIGHPYPQTYRVLRRNLPQLQRQGVQLVTLSRLLSDQRPPVANPEKLEQHRRQATPATAGAARPLTPPQATRHIRWVGE